MTSFFKWMSPGMDKYIYRICQVLMYSLSINLTIGFGNHVYQYRFIFGYDFTFMYLNS